jgi:hypothetical protein
MHPHERDVLPKIGPHFLLGSDGAVLFKFVVDVNNVLGPRIASEADKATHPEAWARFEREHGAELIAAASAVAASTADFREWQRQGVYVAEEPISPRTEAVLQNLEVQAIPVKRRGRPPKAA